VSSFRKIVFQATTGMLLMCLLRFCWLPKYVTLARRPDEIPRLTPNEWLGLGITLLLMSVVSVPIYRFALLIGQKQKQRWLDVYLLHNSPARHFLSGSTATHIKAAIAVIVLAPMAYIACFSYEWLEILGITSCMAIAMATAAYVRRMLSDQIVSARLGLICINTFLAVGVLASTTVLAAIKLVRDSSVITVEITDEAIVEEVKKVHHPVHGMEILLRGQKAFELYLLKAKGTLPDGVGILLYFFFFLPAALPLVAVAYTFGGTGYGTQ